MLQPVRTKYRKAFKGEFASFKSCKTKLWTVWTKGNGTR